MKDKSRYLYSAAYYALELDFFTMEMHRHDRYEIMYMVKGQCQIETAKEVITLKDRSFIFLNRNIAHRLIIEKGTKCTLLNYEFGYVNYETKLDQVILEQNIPALRTIFGQGMDYFILSDHGKMEYALKDLIDELEQEEKDDYLLALLFQRMLIELVRSEQRKTGAGGITHLRKGEGYIKRNLTEEIGVSEVAAHVGLNKSYLQVLFQQHYGCGIKTYINNQRIEKATFLLKNTNLPIIDIAVECGYNSRQHFAYTFAKRQQMSPQKYRKLNSQTIIVNNIASFF